MTKKELNRQRILNGGRGAGQVYVHLVDYYENKIFLLENKISELEEANKLQAARLKEKGNLLTQAVNIIKNIIKVTWAEGWNYSLEWKVKAENYIKGVEE